MYIDGFQVEKETDEEMDTTIMPGLESEKSAAKKKNKKNQQGQCLKILTPKQMLSRLPIFLA